MATTGTSCWRAGVAEALHHSVGLAGHGMELRQYSLVAGALLTALGLK